MCGGTIKFEPGATVGVCDSCGTKQTLPKANDDVVSNLFNRANNLRLKGEFDKASDTYEKILDIDDSESEAHWGLLLCRYGIEYVEDPKTYTRIPTCHRTQYESILNDDDYKAALDNADFSQKEIYEKEAAEIDRIQKEAIKIAKDEDPFDVFICYKETDDNGKRTVDSSIANDIYYQLTQEGFKVFYSAITLEDKLGEEYEPYIFAALNSAKVMLVLGTKPEYFTSVWVKNEWSRFLKLIKSDSSKLLIPCYRDMDAYDLPDEFARLQAQDMSKIGFLQDIIRGVKKVITTESSSKYTTSTKMTLSFEDEDENDEEEYTLEKELSNNVTLKRAFMYLKEREWWQANSYCERVLDVDPENPYAYLGKCLADLEISTPEELYKKGSGFSRYLGGDAGFENHSPFWSHTDYKKAVLYDLNNRNGSLRAELFNMNFKDLDEAMKFIFNLDLFKKESKHANELFDLLLEVYDKEDIYNYALKIQNNDEMESPAFNVIMALWRIRDYKDAEQIIRENQDIRIKEAYGVNRCYIITFGTRPDVHYGNNCKPLIWRVTLCEKGLMEMISLFSVNQMPYNSKDENDNEWENSDVREWLNNEFYNDWFTEDEKNRIMLSNYNVVETIKERRDTIGLFGKIKYDDVEYKVNYINKDKIYLYNIYAVNQFLKPCENLYKDFKEFGGWLRSPGYNRDLWLEYKRKEYPYYMKGNMFEEIRNKKYVCTFSGGKSISINYGDRPSDSRYVCPALSINMDNIQLQND